MNLKALTSNELESVIEAVDGILEAYSTLEAAGVLTDDDDIDLVDLSDLLIEELTARAYEDAGYKVNRMLARGELDRYMRPDGQVGYAPPGAWDEAQP